MKPPAWHEVTVFFLCQVILSGQAILLGWCLRGWWETRKRRRERKQAEQDETP